MCTGEYSLLSLALSFISLVQAAAEYYHAKASGKDQDNFKILEIETLKILNTVTFLV